MKFVLPLIPLLFLTSLRAAEDLPEPLISWKYPPEMTGSRVEVYRTIGDVKLNAYIFEPKGHAKTDRRPAAVFFFGGGWKGGTPGQFLPQCLHLAARGMVAISVDYRVKSRLNVFPQDCVRDAKAAIRWVRANAERLGIDPDRVVAGGGSAGGHLAAATALLPGFEDEDNKGVSSMPNAMLLFNPAVVMAPVDGHPDLLTAEKFADIAERCDGRPQEVSPYHFVRAGTAAEHHLPRHERRGGAFPDRAVVSKSDERRRQPLRTESLRGPAAWILSIRAAGRMRPASGPKLHYYKTLAEADAFLESLDYLTPAPITETFDASFDAKRFSTPIPNKNTEVRDGVLWTRGSSGGKYPPMVYLPVSGKDLSISFRYRHLGPGGMLWFFVDGDDGFGSVDHMLRVKLLREGVLLEVDGHTKDANHPLLQKTRPADAVSGAFRTNELFPAEKVDLSANAWHTVKLVFRGESVTMSVDDKLWSRTLVRANFDAAKRKLLWMQNGGEKGIEIDDIRVESSHHQP
jgi:acetyl esterase